MLQSCLNMKLFGRTLCHPTSVWRQGEEGPPGQQRFGFLSCLSCNEVNEIFVSIRKNHDHFPTTSDWFVHRSARFDQKRSPFLRMFVSEIIQDDCKHRVSILSQQRFLMAKWIKATATKIDRIKDRINIEITDLAYQSGSER